MKSEDVGWHQRLTNFRRALAQLQAAVALAVALVALVALVARILGAYAALFETFALRNA